MSIPRWVPPEALVRFVDRSGKKLTREEIERLFTGVANLTLPELGQPLNISDELATAIESLDPEDVHLAIFDLLYLLVVRHNVTNGFAGDDWPLTRWLRWFPSEKALEYLPDFLAYRADPERQCDIVKTLVGSKAADAWTFLLWQSAYVWPGEKKQPNGVLLQLSSLAAQQQCSPLGCLESLAPTVGFDANGRQVIVVENYSVTISLVSAVEPSISDEQGRPWVKPDSKKKHSPVEKRLAKRVRYQLREYEHIKKGMASHLEKQMLTRRTWSKRDWQKLFIDHPIWRGFGVSLIWRTTSGQSFRLNESKEIISTDDSRIQLGDDDILLAHPIDLDDTTIHQWLSQLSDYQVFQPLAQLQRPYARVTADLVAMASDICLTILSKQFEGDGWYRRESDAGTLILAHSMPEKDVTARAIFSVVPKSTQPLWWLSGVELRKHAAKDILPLTTLDDMTHSEVWGKFIAMIRQCSQPRFG